MKYKILVVDDNESNLDSTGKFLRRLGYDVELARSGDEAISRIRKAKFTIVLLDYSMPGKNGPAVIREIREFNKEVVILIHSAYRTTENVYQSFRAGTADFIEKTENTADLEKAIAAACSKYDEATRCLRPPMDSEQANRLFKAYGITGRSSAMIQILELVEKFRVHQSNTLVLGESGTGKELIAKALHAGAPSRFYAINCGDFATGELLCSALFGHEKGAFTGADSLKIGVFEEAKGGTVFLDEIHCLDRIGQDRLLRAIRERKIRRVGSTKELDVDFKLIAASKPDLEKKAEQNEFSPDLFYRLNFLKIVIPPLRERTEDIEPLIIHFCKKYEKVIKQEKTFYLNAVRALEKYPWLGNVGELEACVFQGLVRSNGKVVGLEDLDPKYTKGTAIDFAKSLPELDNTYKMEKRTRIIDAVTKSRGSIADAADLLGVKRSTLHTLLTRMGIRPEIGNLT